VSDTTSQQMHEFTADISLAWGGVEISVATENPAAGFFINSTGLHNNYTSTAGWLACDWWHGMYPGHELDYVTRTDSNDRCAPAILD
jgi:hypothetical protein